jgi:hypothetical protein
MEKQKILFVGVYLAGRIWRNYLSLRTKCSQFSIHQRMNKLQALWFGFFLFLVPDNSLSAHWYYVIREPKASTKGMYVLISIIIWEKMSLVHKCVRQYYHSLSMYQIFYNNNNNEFVLIMHIRLSNYAYMFLKDRLKHRPKTIPPTHFKILLKFWDNSIIQVSVYLWNCWNYAYVLHCGCFYVCIDGIDEILHCGCF